MKKTYSIKADILTLEQTENVYSWKKQNTVWVSNERENRLNIFSRIGLGTESVIFNLHPTAITLHEILFLKGQHYFITSIEEISLVEIKVKTAMVNPIICTAKTEISAKEDENLEPILVTSRRITFPAILTEKYLKHSQDSPMAIIEELLVLITPKVIVLREADVVSDGKKEFIVQVCHILDEFKNEYEIQYTGDVGADEQY